MGEYTVGNDVLADKIHQKAIEAGFDGCGIINISEMDGFKEKLEDRYSKVPGSRQFYTAAIETFLHISETYPWAKSVIVCMEWMGKYKFPKSLQGKYAKAFVLSEESLPEHGKKKDFEEWLKSQGIRFAGGMDNVPTKIFPLRYAAVKAGLGIIRKNNFFYGEKGSYYELDGYLIDQECEYLNTNNLKPCSDKCPICQNSCKTKALCAPYTMNPLSCVSFWTTFGGGNVPPHLTEEQLGSWICGCDNCQDNCPHNRHDWSEGEDFPNLADVEEFLKPESILKASDEELREKAIPLTASHIPPDKTEILRVNAKRVLRLQQ